MTEDVTGLPSRKCAARPSSTRWPLACRAGMRPAGPSKARICLLALYVAMSGVACSGQRNTDATPPFPRKLLGSPLSNTTPEPTAHRPIALPVERATDFDIASTGCSRHAFGESIAASRNTLLVGAPWRDYGARSGSDVPAACTYQVHGERWSLTQRMTAPTPEASEGYGRAVALEESVAVVGSAGHENGDAPTVAYTLVKGHATSYASLEQPGTPPGLFEEYGAAVATDGRRVIVGALLHGEPKCEGCGAFFLFDRHGHPAHVVEGSVTSENLGASLAISGDLVVAGAAAYFSGGRLPGAAIVYRLDHDRPRQICRLVGNAAGEQYGTSVAVDGRFVVVGADGGPRFTLHEVRGDSCIQTDAFVSAGSAVAISMPWIVAGAPRFNGGAASSGRVGLFRVSADGKLEHRAWISPRRALNLGMFGASVAVTQEWVFAGAPGVRDDDSGFVGVARL